MSNSKHYDYLIVGQGLAGSLVAWNLIMAGQRVLVIDNQNTCAASRVAAGLMNPVTGKRLVKEKHAEKYLLTARECYTQLAKQFDSTFLHDKPMLRLFDSDELKQIWEKRRADRDYQDFIGDALSPETCGYREGGFIQYQTAYLSVAMLLSSIRQWLLELSVFIETEFYYQDLQIGALFRWRDCTADRVIFCEGARISQNPWFNTLPMQPTQGEILTLRTEEKLPTWIVNAGQWLLPLVDGLFKLGATYIWPGPGKPLDENISETGKQSLLKALPKLFPSLKEYELVEHAVGIRPNSKDKRPLIGFHAQYNNMAVFNGFGSKGSMLIPYYAQNFTNVLLTDAVLDEDVDINRIVA